MFYWTALPLLYTVLGTVNVSTMKDDVLRSVAFLTLCKLGLKQHTVSLVSVAFFDLEEL